MVDTQILTFCNPSCDPLELKAGQERKQENQAEKQRKRVNRSEKSLVGGLISEIDEKYEDKIYEISEHGQLNPGRNSSATNALSFFRGDVRKKWPLKGSKHADN